MFKRLSAGAIFAFALAQSAAVSAAPIVFFGENLNPGGALSGDPVTAHNSFLAGLTGVGTETFEGQTGSVTPLALSFPGSVGSITATLTGSGGVCGGAGTVGGIGCTPFGRFPTSGTNWFHTTAPGFGVSFSTGISAFGFYGTDIGDFSGQLTATAITTGGVAVDFVIPHTLNSPNGALLFWGFIDSTTEYSSITFGASTGNDVFGFDDLIVGDPQQIVRVPEPASLGLLGLGLVGLFGLRSRKRA